jgi:xylitol oxidase
VQRQTNWAGNYTYQASTIHRPQTVEEIQEIVARIPRIRGLGTGHTFHDIADSAELISLGEMEPGIEIDTDLMTASVSAGAPYGIFGKGLHERGFALHNTGSLPHISVGGATATSTHGSGDSHRNLSSAVSALEFVTSAGEIVRVRRGDPEFNGMVVHLGTLGIVTRVTFDIEQTYQVCQEVCERLPWDDLTTGFDDIFSSTYSVSIFTMYREHAGTLWMKHRLKPDEEPAAINRWGATAALDHRHPVDTWTGEDCNPQMLIPGAWYERLPHFRMGGVPASEGGEIQAEYMVDRSHALDVVQALRDFEPAFRDLLVCSEIRTIAADDLWLSTAYGRETVAFHFSLKLDQERVDKLLPKLEDVLSQFEPRPHWGKVFAACASDLEPRYERFDDFRSLMKKYDPNGKFHNEFIRTKVLG